MTDTIATATTAATDHPYEASWIDTFFGWMTGLPGPTWLAYIVLAAASVALSSSALWLSGLAAWGTFVPVQVFWGVSTAGIVAAAHHLRNVAGSAFDRFRPALGAALDDPERARFELTVMPARPIAIVTFAGFAITPLYYIFDPAGSQVEGLSTAGFMARWLSEGLFSVVFLGITYHAIRQLRGVTRLHAIASDADPFRPVPLYAFSRLTAEIAVVLILFVSGGLLTAPEALSSATSGSLTGALWLPWLVGTPIVAAVVFIVPLLGMHGRLDAEKHRLETAADDRMRALILDLDEAIDARATDPIDTLGRAVSALRHERELIARLPTWPWSTGTIRGFGSALLVPIILFLIQRYLASALGG